MVIGQHVIERDFEGAMKKLEAYVQKTPEAAPQFEALKRLIDQEIEKE